MTNGAFDSLDEIMDIESHNVDKMAKSLGIVNPFRWRLIKKTSRDNARTPMQWSQGKNAGFTSGTPWLKVNPNFTDINVESDERDPEGIIAFFKKMNAFRKSSKILLCGDFEEIKHGRSTYAFKRSYNGESFTVVLNFSVRCKKLPVCVKGERVISSYADEANCLRPYEFSIFQS